MRLQVIEKAGKKLLLRIDGLRQKALGPRNISAVFAIPGLRKIEDLFVNRAALLIETTLGPIFALNITEPERRTRIDTVLEALTPQLEEEATKLISQAYQAAMLSDGYAPAFEDIDRRAMESVLSLPDGLVPALQNFSDDLRLQLEQTMREALGTRGFSLKDLVARMREVTNEERYRLERIARTETTRIANVARETQWRKFADPNAREYHWIRAQDHLVCERCEGIASMNPWTLDELKRQTTGFLVHPFCRCVIVRRPLG